MHAYLQDIRDNNSNMAKKSIGTHKLNANSSKRRKKIRRRKNENGRIEKNRGLLPNNPMLMKIIILYKIGKRQNKLINPIKS